MIDGIDVANFVIVSAGLVLTVLGLTLTLIIHGMERAARFFFVSLFSILILYVASNFTSQVSLVLFAGNGNFASLSRSAIFLESFFSSLLMPLLSLFLLHCAGEDWKKEGLFYMAAVSTLWIVYFILLIVTQFTTSIYAISAMNVYRRGPFYPLLLVSPALLMTVNLIALFRRREKLTKRQFNTFLICLVLPLASMLVQMYSYGILCIVFGSTLSSLVMFLTLLNDQIEKSIQQKNDIMVLQMRPHFIYNTMSSIYYLCALDPAKAQQVTRDFTAYLQRNFRAIAGRKAIPFCEELEHTKAYLAVEKARYEKLLIVEYDTPHTEFRLPPLTLQPIVENAVKHGLSQDRPPLYVLIRTSREKNGSVVIVEDTGPGFEPEDIQRMETLRIPVEDSADTGELEPHIGLSNARERVRLLCGGTLDISRREGGGTVVKIWIPEGRGVR